MKLLLRFASAERGFLRKITVFWDVTFRSLVDTSRRFRITCRIYRRLWQQLLLKRLYIYVRLRGVTLYCIQGDSGGQVSILDSDNIGHCENKS